MNSEELYKKIEDKIITATSVTNHAFDEASWKKMEALLNKNKTKRWPFLWIFGFLLLAVFFLGGELIYHSIKKGKQPAIAFIQGKHVDEKPDAKKIPQPISLSNDKNDGNETLLPIKNKGNENIKSAKEKINAHQLDDININLASVNSGKAKNAKQFRHLKYNTAALLNSKSNDGSSKNIKTKIKIGADKYNTVTQHRYNDSSKFVVNSTNPDAETDALNKAVDKIELDFNIKTTVAKTTTTLADQIENEKIDKVDTAVKKINPITKATAKKDINKKRVSGVYLFASAGAEANSTKLFSFKNSPLTPVYGIGIGYQLSRRFSLQAGFYAGTKKYIAGPNDYTVKAGSYLSMVKIIKVDADCIVYQIPVTLQYNWIIKPKINYYATVGISSYIMKNEKYNYTIERNYAQYNYLYDYTKNSHLFASLQFSIGVEKQIAHKFYLQAAPIITIPLQGVGEGSVKIFTTGMQLGLKYFLFQH